MTRPSSRRLGAVLLAVTVLATACGGARTPTAPDAGAAHTAVTPRQAVQILATVDATMVRAVQARSAVQFGARVTGPAAAVYAASITVQAGLKLTPVVPPSPSRPRLLLTLAGPWPRWFAAAGASPASPTPLLQVLTSPDPRTPYGLWAQLNLLPGTTLPEVASASIGAATLTPTTTGLATPPVDALAHYTDLLNRGDASAYKSAFTDDAFRRELTNQLATDRKAFQATGVGTVISVHTLAADPPLVMATMDGGALVIGRVDERYTATVAAGRGQVRLDTQIAVLAGKQTVSQRLERRAVEVLALHVPRAGTTDKITLIAASKSDVAVTGS